MLSDMAPACVVVLRIAARVLRLILLFSITPPNRSFFLFFLGPQTFLSHLPPVVIGSRTDRSRALPLTAPSPPVELIARASRSRDHGANLTCQSVASEHAVAWCHRRAICSVRPVCLPVRLFDEPLVLGNGAGLGETGRLFPLATAPSACRRPPSSCSSCDRTCAHGNRHISTPPAGARRRTTGDRRARSYNKAKVVREGHTGAAGRVTASESVFFLPDGPRVLRAGLASASVRHVLCTTSPTREKEGAEAEKESGRSERSIWA